MEVRSIQAIVRALNDAQVRYLIVGGLAVNAYGVDRFTNDIDLVISLETCNILSGIQALFFIGYRPLLPVTESDIANPEMRRIWEMEKGMKVLQLWSDQHRRTPVDIFIREPFDFNAEYSRVKSFDVGDGIFANFVDRNTLIKMKRAVGRPQDLLDNVELEKIASLEEG